MTPTADDAGRDLTDERHKRARREWIAVMALQGLLAGGQTLQMPPSKVAGKALEYADALIAELNQ
ncbi:hypothetical protein E7T09_04590 [Deinococcus sp. KSM4-11]|uniref:hypothetical protein n=1 Tax=Deinococcus sp. KSM4-11 TaxID=2568654 RepID=UPI0010A31351|nr:hypothetical protein [Deinococcus sp. KSM4-11]THF88489.1 hypothetical protein E7T09_04590 [Deinococcus sp. KSM4-11]